MEGIAHNTYAEILAHKPLHGHQLLTWLTERKSYTSLWGTSIYEYMFWDSAVKRLAWPMHKWLMIRFICPAYAALREPHYAV